MTTNELMKKSKVMCQEYGLNIIHECMYNDGTMYSFSAYADDKTEHAADDRYLSFSVVYRHNGTQENVSICIEYMTHISATISRATYRIKYNINSSDRVIFNRISKAVDWLTAI